VQWRYSSTHYPRHKMYELYAPAVFAPQEPPSTSLTDWVGPRAGLDVVAKRKFLPLPGIELQSSNLDRPLTIQSPVMSSLSRQANQTPRVLHGSVRGEAGATNAKHSLSSAGKIRTVRDGYGERHGGPGTYRHIDFPLLNA
jgi:hypothetical protein